MWRLVTVKQKSREDRKGRFHSSFAFLARRFGFRPALILSPQFLAQTPFFTPELQGMFHDLVFEFGAISGRKISQAEGARGGGDGSLFHRRPQLTATRDARSSRSSKPTPEANGSNSGLPSTI